MMQDNRSAFSCAVEKLLKDNLLSRIGCIDMDQLLDKTRTFCALQFTTLSQEYKLNISESKDKK